MVEEREILEIRGGLQGVSEENRLWVAMLKGMRRFRRSKEGELLKPGVSNEERQYWAGFVAGLDELENYLVGQREIANRKDAN